MWSSLRADFTEFVSTVQQDTSTVLSTLDDNLDVTGQAISDVDQERTATGMPDSNAKNDLNDRQDDDETTGDVQDDEDTDEDGDEDDLTPADVYDILITSDEPFLQPLEVPTTGDEDSEDTQLKEFDAAFTVEDQTETISKLLEEHSETLQVTFSRLASDVPYEQFWRRYFYRCHDEERRMEYFETTFREIWFEQRRVRREEEMAANPIPSLSTVTNFLGGAVKALVHDNGGNNDDDADGGDATVSNVQQTAAGALSFFGGQGGRPPFVMNTAVSDDDDDGGDTNEEDVDEDEEELAWDDDDDDDDEDGADEDGSGPIDMSRDESQIEFNDVEKDKLQAELAQAMSEQEQLQATIEMQTKELNILKSGIGENPEVAALKMQLFEKESEVAAYKARFEDDDDDEALPSSSNSRGEAESAEAIDLRSSLADRDAAMAELEKECKHLYAQLASIGDKSNPDKAAADELARIQAALADTANNAEQKARQLSAANQEKTALENQVKSLSTQMEGMQATLGESASHTKQLAEAMNMNARLEAERNMLQAKADALAIENTRLLEDSQNTTKLEQLDSDLKKLEASKSALDTELTAMKQKVLELQAANQKLQSASASSAAHSQAETSSLQEQIILLQKELADANQQTSSTVGSASKEGSPGSSSTGVKVAVEADGATAAIMNKITDDDDGDVGGGGGGNEEDGWGDDW